VLSRQVKHLERRLGTQLLNRTTRRLQPTGPAGERRELLMPQRLSANSPMVLRAAAIGGLGIASFDRFIAHDALRDGTR